MYIEPKIYEFIKSLREKYPRLGKDKIKIFKEKVFGYEVNSPSDLSQLDTIVRFEHGIKWGYREIQPYFAGRIY